MTGYEEFFAWCKQHGLKGDKMIALAFGMTPQTVRNWRLKLQKGEGQPPAWLKLACRGFEVAKAETEEPMPSFPKVDMTWFEVWRNHHKLKTLELTGAAFGVTRQAIHNWHKRASLPRWLPLACLGYEHTEPEGEEVAA